MYSASSTSIDCQNAKNTTPCDATQYPHMRGIRRVEVRMCCIRLVRTLMHRIWARGRCGASSAWKAWYSVIRAYTAKDTDTFNTTAMGM